MPCDPHLQETCFLLLSQPKTSSTETDWQVPHSKRGRHNTLSIVMHRSTPCHSTCMLYTCSCSFFLHHITSPPFLSCKIKGSTSPGIRHKTSIYKHTDGALCNGNNTVFSKTKWTETYTFQQVQLNLHILRLQLQCGKQTKCAPKEKGNSCISRKSIKRGKFWFCSVTHNCTWYAAGSPLACPASPNQQKPKPTK